MREVHLTIYGRTNSVKHILASSFLAINLLVPIVSAAQSPTAEKGFPAVGTRITLKTTTNDVTTTKTWTVLEPGTYDKHDVYRMTTETETRVYDMTTRNLMAVFLDGKRMETANPHRGTYSFPLTVGKSWNARFTLWRAENNRTDDVFTGWKAVRYEDVTVPAGTFKAIMLEGKSPWVTAVIWYVPELNLDVKSSSQVFSTRPGGTQYSTTELVDYVKP
jgi:hypothetical protein